MTHPTIDDLAREIGFVLPEAYNASRLLWDNLPARADRPAVIHDERATTYAELAAEAARIGHALRRHADPGDRVLLFMDDEPAYPAAILGAMRAGLVPMLINTLSPGDLIDFFLSDSGAQVVVVSGEFAPLFADCPVPVLNADTRPWAEEPADLPEHPTARRDMAFWMYSSGSTGRPKGVVHKHEDAAYTARSYADHVLKLGEWDVCFSVPKIFFAYGFGNSVTFPFAAGAASVLMSGRPTPDRIFAEIARARPTVFFGLPTLYTAMVKAPEAAGADLASVRLCVSAAEILSEEVAGAWADRFGHRIVEGLGSTEMLHIYLSNSPDRQVPGAAGRAVPGYAIRLLDPDGAETDEGVMQVRGLSGAEYYWKRPDKTAEAMRDGWLDTGDRFSRSAEGDYYFKGRADDLVKVSGQWVWPMEIELALNEHPAVFESCVMAVEMPDRRMTIRAHVAPVPGAAGDDALAAALQAHCKVALLPHKYPREVVFHSALPKTGTGKIDRQALKRGG